MERPDTPKDKSKEIQFDEETHAYSLDGDPYDGVTTVLKAVIPTDTRWFQPKHRWRGSMVHAVCEAINDGDWSPEAVEVPANWSKEDRDGIVSRGIAYQNFTARTGYKPAFSEFRVYSKTMRLAGTIDTGGLMPHEMEPDVFCLIDVKSGIASPVAFLQLALYDLLLQENHPGLSRATAHIILQVKSNGSTRPIYRTGHELVEDERDAISAFNVFRFRKRHNLL